MGENGSTRPQNSVIHQHLVVIFKITLITGIMILPGVYFFMKAFREPVAGVPIGLIGLGILGAGICPGNVTPWNGLFGSIALFSISDYSLVNWVWRLFAGHPICKKVEYGRR